MEIQSHCSEFVEANGMEDDSANKPTLCASYPNKPLENCGKINTSIPDVLVVKQTDMELLLPRYTEVLARSHEHGVKMEDLDPLQSDLETLLSACAIRQRLLLFEVEPTEVDTEIRKNQGNKYCQKQQHMTNKLMEEKSLHKPKRIRPNNLPHHSFHMIEISRVNLSRNPVADDFWMFIKPFFAKITKHDILFLDCLMKESMQDIYVRYANCYSNFYTNCPRSKQFFNTEKPARDMVVGTKYKIVKPNSLEIAPLATYDSRSNINRNNDLSLEIERCVKELTSVRNNNLVSLRKLKTAVRKNLYSQLKRVSRDAHKQF